MRLNLGMRRGLQRRMRRPQGGSRVIMLKRTVWAILTPRDDARDKEADGRVHDESRLANKLFLKVADLAAIAGDYQKSIENYERVAKSSISSNLMKWSVKDYFLKAGICYLAANVLPTFLLSKGRKYLTSCIGYNSHLPRSWNLPWSRSYICLHAWASTLSRTRWSRGEWRGWIICR